MGRVVAVPAVNLAAAARVRDTASLLRAAVARQSSLLGQLKSGLQACHGLVVNSSLSSTGSLAQALAEAESSADSNLAAEISRKIDAAMKVDLAAVKACRSMTVSSSN